MKGVLFRPRHQKHFSILYDQTNYYCTRYLRHIDENQKRKLISEIKDTRKHCPRYIEGIVKK